MLKAAAIGLLIAIVMIFACQIVSSLTYHRVQKLAMRYAGETYIPVSLTERLAISFSNFWARYFLFLSILIVPVCVSAAMLAALIRSKRVADAA